MSRWDALQVTRADRSDPAVMVARLSGLLDSTPESYAFLAEVQREARRGGLRLVIDLHEVAHLGSAGVGVLAACYTSVTGHGGRMCLTGATGRIEMILRVVHLLDVLDHADTEEEAVRRAAG